jgi:hypothetical protein
LGLSCTAIFEKRLNYPSAFDQFNIERIACHDAHKKIFVVGCRQLAWRTSTQWITLGIWN